MWRTSNGTRTLKGAEARLFAEALWSLLDAPMEDCEYGIQCFDSLTSGQKASVLSTIGNCLLREDVPAVPLTAVLEGGIATVFQFLRVMVELELDSPETRTDCRELIIAAREQGQEEEIADLSCEDMEEWELEIEGLEDCILWDSDYQDHHLYMDYPPEDSMIRRYVAGISDEYFTGIVDDLRDDGQIERTLSELRTLCRSVCESR